MEEIKAEFLNSGVPATGLTPTITIRTADGSIVVNAENMTEIADGRYTYQFETYNKSQSYFFRADGGPTLGDSDRYIGNINFLDSYQNKNDWKGGGSTVIGMPQQERKELAKNIWDEMTEDHKNKGSFGELVQTLEKEDKDKDKKEKEKKGEKEKKHKEILEEIKKSGKDIKADNSKNTIKMLNSLEIIEKKEYKQEKVDYDLIINTITNKLSDISQLIISTIPEEKEEVDIVGEIENNKKTLIKDISVLLNSVKNTLETAIHQVENKNKLDGITKELYYLTDTINNFK